MKPTLIFDKNVFQGLSVATHAAISEKFNVAIPPVLIREIAFGLEKGKPNSTGQSPREFVAGLIRKFGGRYLFVTPWTELCERELLGTPVRLNGIPDTSIATVGYTEAGKVLLAAHTTDGSIAPYEHFARRVLAGRGQEVEPREREPFTPERALGSLVDAFDGPWQSGTEAEVVRAVDAFLDAQQNMRALLRWIVDSFEIPLNHGPKLRQEVQVKWGLRCRPPFTSYPFSRHVAKVSLLYFAGLHLWPKHENDEIDLEYLKYLPLCHNFATNDRLLRRLGSHLVDASYQRILTQEGLTRSDGGTDRSG